MQRQSLGSPVSKLHSHGVLPKEDSLIAEDSKRKSLPPPSSSSVLAEYDEEYKATKPHRSLPPNPEKLIHLIPLLTFLCFLILYLCSHSPSQSDLVQFNGFNRPSKHIYSTEISDIDKLNELQKGDVLAIRSVRNLQEIRKHAQKFRAHRKFADF